MIALDPGHGGLNHGGCFRGLIEKHLNLTLCLCAHDDCTVLRYPTMLTRMSDTTTSWRERYKAAKAAGANGVISVHHNGHPNAPGLRGAEAYYWPSNRVTRKLAPYALALMPGEVTTRKAFPATAEPGHEDDWLERPRIVLAAFRELPVLLLEVGYMSNAKESQILTDRSFVARAADAITGTVVKFMELLDEEIADGSQGR